MTKNPDEKFMSYTLNLARKNLGQTAPNPVVGCIIVKENEIISSGVTNIGGRPHAEKIAIEKVANKKNLEGATLYVTLEPCSHFGQTPPCVDEILKHNFKRIVIATQDSDERVNGEGIRRLREAGIDVVCGVLEKEAHEINRGFFKVKKHGMPFVTLKLATSLDGKIATKNFDSKWITSEKARQFSHYLRAINDAILVGANTVKQDNPSLDCRLPGLEDCSPRKVIISKNLDFDWSAKIFQDRCTILTVGAGLAPARGRPESPLHFLACEEKNGLVDLKDALEKLARSGVNSILVEGGQNIATQFLKENLVDELVWIRNKKIIGNDGLPAIGDLGFTKISEVLNSFSRLETKEFSDDLVEIYRR